MRVLVTGATGFLGQHLALQLHGTGHEVTLLVREAYGLGQPLPWQLETLRADLHLVYADLRNYSLTRRAVAEARPELVFHLAAAGVTDPFLSVDTALRHNVIGVANLLRAAFEQSPSTSRLVVARTPGEALPGNAYQASKAAAWSFCQMYARQRRWPISGATIFQAYGPGQPSHALVPAAFTAALQGQDFPMTSGTQKRDWIYVDDVISGLLALAQANLEPATDVDLGTGKATSLIKVVSEIYAVAGCGGAPMPGSLSNRPGEDELQVADVQRTEKLIGWRAAVPLSQGLRRLCAAFKSG